MSFLLECNQILRLAYQDFISGNLPEAIRKYQSAYQLAPKPYLQCTLALLLHSDGQYSSSFRRAQSLLQQPLQGAEWNALRLYSTLTLTHLMLAQYSQSIDIFEELLSMLEKEQDGHKKLAYTKYITFLFFRVQDMALLNTEGHRVLDTLSETLPLEEVFAISLLYWGAQGKESIKQARQSSADREIIERKCYQILLAKGRMDLALVPLRYLALHSKDSKEYVAALQKLIDMGYMHERVDLALNQGFQLIHAFAESLQALRRNIDAVYSPTVSMSEKKVRTDLFGVWIGVLLKRTRFNGELDSRERVSLEANLLRIREEKSQAIIAELMETAFAVSGMDQCQKSIETVWRIFSKVNQTQIQAFKGIFQASKTVQQRSRSGTKALSVIDANSQRHFQGNQSVRKGDTDISCKSRVLSRSKKENMGISVMSGPPMRHMIVGERKIIKMVRMCQHGGFLNKRNYHSDSGENRFVMVTNACIKWGKDPQKINTNCQIYPLKDIRAVFYGKVTPVMKRSSNKILDGKKCFSLLLRQRTLDFYGKDYGEVESWLCGLTSILKRNHNLVSGYTPGRLRWKKMFAILKEHFLYPLRREEKNTYYYENAFVVIQFGKTGYSLKA